MEHAYNLTTIPVSITASGEIIAAVTGKKIKVYAVALVCSAAISLNFYQGSTALGGVMPIATNGGFTLAVSPPGYLFKSAAGANIGITQSGAGTIAGWLSYWASDDI